MGIVEKGMLDMICEIDHCTSFGPCSACRTALGMHDVK